jgi:hypothetical protein|tara:strand:+ start:202 stop:1989 length:1788 start_codon:yes stop_codon:yes gene_type:complete
MGLEKLIGKQVVQMIKDSDRVQKSVTQLKDKLVKESLTVLDKAGIDPAALPFDPIAVLNGDFPDPNSLLTPENVCSIPPISPNKIDSATNAIDNAKAAFSNVVENSNKLKSALIDLQTPLATIQTTGENVEGVITSVSNVTKVIKAIPIPTAFGAPAVALPVKVLTILSSILVRLDKVLVAGKGTVSFVSPMVKSVSGTLNQTISAVGGLEQAVAPALTMLTLVRSTLELGNQCPDVSQADIDDINQKVAGDLSEALLESGDSSLLGVNIEDETSLIASFPFTYKGFLLELVNNPNNATFYLDTDPESPTFNETIRGEDFPFPSRRIRATRDFTADPELNVGSIFVRTKFNTPLGEVILYNDPGGQGRYSYSSSVGILLKEMKFKLDNYLNGVKLLALPAVTEAGTDSGLIRGGGGSTPNPNPQVFTPPPNITPNGSDDPPSPTGSVDPPLPPAYHFTNNSLSAPEVTPYTPILEGTFTVTRPIKIKMTTFGGNGGFSDSTGFLRIYKVGNLNYSFMMEQQYADQMQTITTKNNPIGYYNNNPLDPEYWPINPGYSNGSLQMNTGIFKFYLELQDFNGPLGGGAGNFAKFEIEAQ